MMMEAVTLSQLHDEDWFSKEGKLMEGVDLDEHAALA